MKRRIKGDVGFRKLIRQLPQAARGEMADVLDGAGAELAQAIKADTPVRTGSLRGAITWKLLRSSLKLRVGLIGKRSNLDHFYGRIIEFGRKGKTVQVHRRRNGVNNGLRRGRKKAEDIGAIYSLRVKAKAAHPFVFKSRPVLRTKLGDRLRNYWNDVLARAGEGTSFDD